MAWTESNWSRSTSTAQYFMLPRKRPDPCKKCGDTFTSTSNAKYCSKPACRKAAKDFSRRKDIKRKQEARGK